MKKKTTNYNEICAYQILTRFQVKLTKLNKNKNRNNEAHSKVAEIWGRTGATLFLLMRLNGFRLLFHRNITHAPKTTVLYIKSLR